MWRLRRSFIHHSIMPAVWSVIMIMPVFFFIDQLFVPFNEALKLCILKFAKLILFCLILALFS